MNRLTLRRGEHVAVGVAFPRLSQDLTFSVLFGTVTTEHAHRLRVEAHHPGPPALGGAFHSPAVDDGDRTGDADLRGVEVDVRPAQAQQFPAPNSRTKRVSEGSFSPTG